MGNRVDVSTIHSSSKWLGLGSIGVGVAVEVLKRCRCDVGDKDPSILTFILGWGSVALSRAMGGFAKHG